MGAADDTGHAPKQEPYIARFRRMLSQQQTRCAPVIRVGRRPRFSLGRECFPFASVSMLVVLTSMFLLSMHLGGWTWSSWTYAFSLGIDTIGDIIFDVAGVATAAMVIARHRVTAIKRPFWHDHGLSA